MVGISGTGLSYSEESPWARPKPHVQTSALPAAAPGIEVAELPHVEEIELPPAPAAQAVTVPTSDEADDVGADPRLVPIALAIAALVAIVALAWALLV